jgi:molybdate transport system substrate-binding protein
MRKVVCGIVAAALLASGCSGNSANDSTVSVLAASSLTETFTTLGKQFEQAHRGIHVELNFGASSALATSIVNRAPADVFASAAPGPMQTVLRAGRAGGAEPFATNVLEIAVARGNPRHITGLADLGDQRLKVALCDPAVPCGSAAKQVLARAGVRVAPVSLETDVKATLAKVRLGEVDAALVYVTDVRAAGAAVAGVAIPAAQNVRNSYPIAVIKGARPAREAQEFVDFVRSAQGQAVLAAAGFGPASA